MSLWPKKEGLYFPTNKDNNNSIWTDRRAILTEGSQWWWAPSWVPSSNYGTCSTKWLSDALSQSPSILHAIKLSKNNARSKQILHHFSKAAQKGIKMQWMVMLRISHQTFTNRYASLNASLPKDYSNMQIDKYQLRNSSSHWITSLLNIV